MINWLSHTIALPYRICNKVIMLYLLIFMAVASTVVDACSDVYNFSTPVQRLSNFSCAAGDTPLGFQCIEMTYPEFTTDINKYPCFTVNNVSGRHIEVLVSALNMDMYAC